MHRSRPLGRGAAPAGAALPATCSADPRPTAMWPWGLAERGEPSHGPRLSPFKRHDPESSQARPQQGHDRPQQRGRAPPLHALQPRIWRSGALRPGERLLRSTPRTHRHADHQGRNCLPLAAGRAISCSKRSRAVGALTDQHHRRVMCTSGRRHALGAAGCPLRRRRGSRGGVHGLAKVAPGIGLTGRRCHGGVR